ncbi:GIY-YIG nuclease family protein (plasmid) [Phormidium sp. CLA17]|uniref:GIY-YIG nuclease family protein n=1 Tax=Leptolyngbya sp. Cla-17 TaxID=2803751 RepID=UPI0014931329|nr:GIY-YIG nuclease family protein [Leptolyngbya sp. Cla-17]MBM0744753.1 GIY-YIG nuclease family protein [Leptolyngbya sp. Cla-17]MBM0745132.1 GIY-YIG nuclease family protein [Leptolyngbya sp. Cla-17]
MSETLKSDAQMVLKALSSILFEECYPLSRDFEPVPSNPGFYAFRYRDEILYIGIGNNLRRRFRNGHKALSWAFVDRLNPDDVRISTFAMGRRSPQQVEYIETLMIQMARPRYNTRMN